MKFLVGLVILTCLSFPVFSQTRNQQRQRALGEAIGSTITDSTSILADFDSRVKDDGDNKTYTTYRNKYNELARALHESESRLNFLLRTSDRMSYIKEEHAVYDDLLKQLQTVKSDYDTWLRSVQ
ncbi:MAG: hypothetical protein LBH42_07285 [Treponema sp.]|jgi:hypothetical protein|nr:hypothetical protein [Treponema sp.]